MLADDLAILFERDILKLRTEISSYTNDAILWSTSAMIKNSGGNLCLHLLGNLQHFIGGVLGDSGYVRNRPAEFTRKNIPVSDVLREIDHTSEMVVQTISALSEQAMEQEYPEKVFDYHTTTGYFLVHLLAHLNYHVGQINYHRRLLDSAQLN